MGNALVSPCFCNAGMIFPNPKSPCWINLIFWEGSTRVLTGKHVAGEIMFEFPEMMVFHADSFYIGRPVPSLALEDILVPGQSYFVLPIDCFSNVCVLSASTLAVLGSTSPSNDKPKSPINFGKHQPFEYIKGQDGRVLIKVSPEFIRRLISKSDSNADGSRQGPLCSTPELRKHYDQFVGTNKEQVWSPKLETIAEHHNIRFSPCRLLGLERWKKEETELYK